MQYLTRRNVIILVISAVLIIGVVAAVTVFRSNSGSSPQQAFNQIAEESTLDNPLAPPPTVVDESQNLVTAIEIKNKGDYSILNRTVLSDGRIVLDVPLQYLSDPFFDDLKTKIPGLNDISENEFLNTETYQSVFLNPNGGQYFTPGFHAKNISEMDLGGQRKWVYISSGFIRVSDPDFKNSRVLGLEGVRRVESFQPDPQNKDKIMVRTFKVSDFEVSENYELYRVAVADLLKTNESESDENVEILENGDLLLQAGDIDAALADSLNPGTATENGGNGRVPTTEILQKLGYYYWPLANGKIFYQTTYFTDNFWVGEGQTITRQENLQQRRPGFVYTTCLATNNLCYIFSPRDAKLIKVDLNGQKPVNTEINVGQVKTFEGNELLRSLTVTGNLTDKYLTIENGNLVFWNVGEKTVLAKI
jgi:hypothetical protein